MFLLRKQPLVFLKITVSVLSVRDRCNFTKKWTTSPVSFKNFVYFLKAPFNGCFSYQYNISYRHIRVFVKNLIRFPDYKKSHFHFIFYLFYSTNYLVYRCEDYWEVDTACPTLFSHSSNPKKRLSSMRRDAEVVKYRVC